MAITASSQTAAQANAAAGQSGGGGLDYSLLAAIGAAGAGLLGNLIQAQQAEEQRKRDAIAKAEEAQLAALQRQQDIHMTGAQQERSALSNIANMFRSAYLT